MPRFSIVAALVVLGVAACGGPLTTGSDPLSVTSSDDGRTLAVAPGRELDVLLHTTGPGNYGDPAVSSDAVSFIDMTYPSAQNPGGPTQLYRFKGEKEGGATITIPSTTEGKAPFLVRVVVEK